MLDLGLIGIILLGLIPCMYFDKMKDYQSPPFYFFMGGMTAYTAFAYVLNMI